MNTVIGILLPLCSRSVISVGVGLRSNVASEGASVRFLISTPQTGVDSILVSASLLGWPFALFEVTAGLVMGVAGSVVTQLVSRNSPKQPETDDNGARPVSPD